MPEEEEGAPCLLCLATASGLPLFCRPPRPQLPFSLVGALHGVHLFGAMEGAELRQAATPTAHVTWGTYGNSISLILLSPSPAPARILDSAFGAMVLVLGLDELVPVRNVERLKRDLRSCFGLIDALLTPRGGWGLGPPCRPLPPATPREALQDRLQRFGGAAHTDLCCLCFGSGGFGGSVLGTPRWGALSGADSAPLRALMMTSSWGGGANGRGPAARDLPVFLPNSSPQVPHRLLLLRLLPGLLLALLCGPRPSLQLLLAQEGLCPPISELPPSGTSRSSWPPNIGPSWGAGDPPPGSGSVMSRCPPTPAAASCAPSCCCCCCCPPGPPETP
ncbi:protein fuzzy homolog isoform X3 [Poecile atricapillus]|uniref:protein fuzzy homolog isoform X3 n=1 Tax=Poecile atricapillus TaxID=48891 RepID=UPI00273A1F76|nr:protein fuzzy homolog isoform X3 [Poecile atricapillus]